MRMPVAQHKSSSSVPHRFGRTVLSQLFRCVCTGAVPAGKKGSSAGWLMDPGKSGVVEVRAFRCPTRMT